MKKLAVVVAAILAATPAFATNGMRLTGFGAVQGSMGGVGVGASLDSGTVMSNPAGMADLGGRFDFGATYFSATVETNLPGFGKSTRGATPIPAFGLVLPIGKDLRFGFGAYGVAGMGVDYTGGHTNFGLMRFAPALSYKLLDILSVGAAVNVMYANLDFAIFGPGGIVAPGGSGFGFGATVAAKVTALPILDIAVAYETKSDLADFEFNALFFPPAPPPPYATGPLTVELDLPPVVTFGVAVKPLPLLLVAADVQLIQWSSTQGTSNMLAPGISPGWKDQWVYKLGAQVDLLDILKVRAGFNYGKNPTDPTSPVFVFLPALSETHISLGAGLALGSNVTVNVGGVISPKVTVSQAATSTSGYTVEGSVAVTY
ncbi:MAG TPA: outer membrane protein transport protein [Anaeromyxobacteraceae bacterium]|nr:outer membrane protein transport protein [Anaeromyxobacteraceae bacterium]